MSHLSKKIGSEQKMSLISRALGTVSALAFAFTLCQGLDIKASAKTGVVTADSLNVRTGAGTNNSIITSISEGTSVTINGSASLFERWGALCRYSNPARRFMERPSPSRTTE